jgi:hypothetical protein
MKQCIEAGIVTRGPIVQKNKDYATTMFVMKKSFTDVIPTGVCGEGDEQFCVILPGIDFVEIADELCKGYFVLVKGYYCSIKEVASDRKTAVDDYLLAEHVQIINPS